MKTVLNINNKKGMTLVECMIALLLTTVAVVSLITMQSLAWRGAGKSDYMGRAEGILQRELETHQSEIMWGTPLAGTKTTCADASGGNVDGCGAGTFFTIIYTPTIKSATTYLVNVKVTWPSFNGSTSSITSSIFVSR